MEVDHCALALCHYWRTTRGRRLTSSVLKGLIGTSISLSTIRRSRCTTAKLTIRGGGMPYSNLALDADRENGPAARSFAADAHDCIMVRIKRSCRIQVCGAKMRPQWRAPLGSLNRPTDSYRPDTEAMPKARLAVHRRSACSGVKACPWLEQGALRNTSAAKWQAAKLC